MRAFTVDARYARYIESAISLALADVGRDLQRRASNRKRTIPDSFIDPDATGAAVILIGQPEQMARAINRESEHTKEPAFVRKVRRV